jgi:putative endonuclease
MKTHLYYIYILTNSNKTVFYTGVTNDLVRRIHEHKLGMYDGFTKKYNVHKLVYYEEFHSIVLAIEREKKIKKYSRQKKITLIENFNKAWENLYKNGLIEWIPNYT